MTSKTTLFLYRIYLSIYFSIQHLLDMMSSHRRSSCTKIPLSQHCSIVVAQERKHIKNQPLEQYIWVALQKDSGTTEHEEVVVQKEEEGTKKKRNTSSSSSDSRRITINLTLEEFRNLKKAITAVDAVTAYTKWMTKQQTPLPVVPEEEEEPKHFITYCSL